MFIDSENDGRDRLEMKIGSNWRYIEGGVISGALYFYK